MYHGRGKNRIQKPYVLKDIYKEYIQGVEEGSPYDIPYNLFVKLYEEFYKEVMDYIFEGGLYTFPHRMGDLSILGKRPKELNKKTMSINWEATNKLGKIVRHTNDHSNYMKYVFHWSKKLCYVKNKSQYRLVLTRDNKRRLASVIKSGEYNFFTL